METDSSLSAIALAVSFVLFAIATIAEASIASATRRGLRRLVSENIHGSVALERLCQRPGGATGALSLAKAATFSSTLISALSLAVSRASAGWTLIALTSLAAVIVLWVTHSAIGALASAYGRQIALKIALPVNALAWFLKPALAAQAALAPRAGLSGNGNHSSQENLTDDISLPMDTDGEPLDEHEVRMIRGVVRLDKTIAREIMVPRVDMTAVEVETPIDQLAEQMIAEGHSKLPVYRGDLDHIEGIAYALDALRCLVGNTESSEMLLESVIRPVLFIPESKTLEELLNEFQQKRMQLAVVIDEYGGVSGLVTVEDLLEEIVGEIQDEFDFGEPEIRSVNSNEFLMDAGVGIDQLNELLNVSVEAEGFDTVGGFVYDQLGRIPSTGDTVEYNGLSIEVISTIGRRLKHLKVVRSAAKDS